MKASSLLIALATVGHAVTYLVAAPPHVMDASWPPHARFHVLQALLWALGFNVLVLVVVARAYGRGERWSWWALATAWLFLHVAYFACLPAVPGGAPTNPHADFVLGALLVVYALGLVLGRWRLSRL
ncbi:MAG TPA: hypothetical protein VKN99_27485 [Polyangia bacterium]|nr:hypothetical protein [Polyangia bacterium]